MKRREGETTVAIATQALRRIVLAAEVGELIGSEDSLIARLGCSRSSVRQAARLLEREGLLTVRRGIKGGYFGARPDARTIEAAVSSYLEALHVDPWDATIIASALWVEVMRKAASADRDKAEALAKRLTAKVKALKDGAGFDKVLELEFLARSEIFDLSGASYVKLIFDINLAFSRRRPELPVVDDTSEAHIQFVRTWRDAKLIELGAIAQGDPELAAMAARHSRGIWHGRILSRYGPQGSAGAEI